MFGNNLKTILLILSLNPDQTAIEHADKIGYDLNYGHDIPYQKFRTPKDAGNYVIHYIDDLCFRLGWNHSKFNRNISVHAHLVMINNRTCKIVRFDPYTKRFTLKKCIPVSRFYDGYVYLGVGNFHDTCTFVCTTSELSAFQSLSAAFYAFNDEADSKDQILVYKISVHKFGKPNECMEELSTYHGRLYDNVFYYDIIDHINKEPTALYDYCMRLIQYERIQYNLNGDRIKSDWVYGYVSPKGMSDFYTPEIYQKMIESGDPFWWDHEFDDIENYGNVIAGSNITKWNSIGN